MNGSDSDLDERHRALEQGIVVRGRVGSGLGEGRFFTELTWAKAQFVAKLGIDPFPGTFNVTVEDSNDQRLMADLRRGAGVMIEPDSPKFCSGKCFGVILDGDAFGAAVFPEVDDYPVDKLEIIASINIKNALNVADGDYVSIRLLPGSALKLSR